MTVVTDLSDPKSLLNPWGSHMSGALMAQETKATFCYGKYGKLTEKKIYFLCILFSFLSAPCE